MSTVPVPVLAPADVPRPFGNHLRRWRRMRRPSQLDLATLAGISTPRLSFIETGREMVLRLAGRLDAPLREARRTCTCPASTSAS